MLINQSILATEPDNNPPHQLCLAHFLLRALFSSRAFPTDIFSYLSFYAAEQRLYLVARWPGLDRAAGFGIKMKKYRFEKSIPLILCLDIPAGGLSAKGRDRFFKNGEMTMAYDENKNFPVSWEELHRNSKALAWRLLELGPFSGVVAVTRGGLVPADCRKRAGNSPY